MTSNIEESSGDKKIQKPLLSQGTSGTAKSCNTVEWIISALIANRIEYRDHRKSGGCLWIVGDNALNPFVSECANRGYELHFKADGCRTFPNRPVWWTKEHERTEDLHLQINDRLTKATSDSSRPIASSRSTVNEGLKEMGIDRTEGVTTAGKNANWNEGLGVKQKSNRDQLIAELFGVDANLFLNVTIDNLGLSARSTNCLMRAHLETIGDILSVSIVQLSYIRNLGVGSLNEILEKVRSFVLNPDNLDTIVADDNTQDIDERFDFDPNLRKAVDSILMGESFSAESLSEEQIEYCKSVEDSVLVLGADICLEAYLNPSYARTLCEALKDFFTPMVNFDNAAEKAACRIRELPNSITNLCVLPFIKVYKAKKGDVLNCLQSVCTEDSVIANIPALYDKLRQENTPTAIIQQLRQFIDWLDFDPDQIVASAAERIRTKFTGKNEKAFEIFSLRTKGDTLEKIGVMYGITRERVRQLEAKFYRLFWNVYSTLKYDPVLLVYALRNGERILAFERIREVFGEDFTTLFWSCIKQTGAFEYYYYSRTLDAVVITLDEEGFQNDEMLQSAITDLFSSLPELIPASEKDKILSESAEKTAIPIETLRAAFNEKYQEWGQFYHMGRLTVVFMCNYVLKHRFESGFKVNDVFESERFRSALTELFGEKCASITNKAIDAKVGELGILCGRGKYIHPDYMHIEPNIVAEIHDYIKNFPRSVLTYGEVYEGLQSVLAETEITNKYLLQGALKKYGCPFSTGRDYISKDKGATSIHSSIVALIKQSKYPVKKTELKARFKGITDIVISFATSDSEVLNYFGEYQYGGNLVIREPEKSYLAEFLKTTMSDGEAHHIKDLYPIIVAERSELFSRNAAFSSYSAFSVLEYLFRGQYQFSRPYIALNSVMIGRPFERLKEYLYSKDFFAVNDISEFAKENHMAIQSLIELINSYNDRFLLLDRDTVASIDEIGVDNDIAKEVESLICNEVSETTPIRDLHCIARFPKINGAWNEWLIYSVTNKWSSKLDVALSSPQFRQATPLISLAGDMSSERFKDARPAYGAIRIDNMDDIDELLADILTDDSLEVL